MKLKHFKNPFDVHFNIAFVISSALPIFLAMAMPPRVAFAALAAHDVSIFVPLQNETTTPGTFGRTGESLCLVPGLNVDGKESLFSSASFEAFASETFASDGAGSCNANPSLSIAKGGDLRVMLDLPPDRPGHLALARGLPNEFCNYAAWKIVAFRFDPCLERSKMPGALTKSDLEGASAKCTNFVRLVAQPFRKNTASDGWIAIDGSMHLIYLLPNTGKQVTEMVTDLKELASISAASVKKTGTPSYWENDSTLVPHPGLWTEIGRCSAGTGPVADSFRALLRKYAPESRLVRVAWMTAGQAAMHWTFGAKKFSNGKPEAGNLPLIGGGHFDNFSLSVLETSTTPDFPFNATLATKTFPHIAPFYGPDLLASAEPKQAALDAIGGLQALQILNNPLRIAQTESSCFSCHFNDQTVESLRG
jgi:hypothetical protein